MQGGTFSPDGLLYLINRYFDKGVEGFLDAALEAITPGDTEVTHFNVHTGGISVFSVDEFKYMGKSHQRGAFRFHWNPSWEVAEEPEGMTFWDLDADRRAPRIRGQVHALLLDNDLLTDDVYIKHYRISEPKPVVPPRLLLYHTHHKTDPKEFRGQLFVDLKGVTHDDDHWYFASKRRLWKVPVAEPLDVEFNGPDRARGVVVRDIPNELSRYEEMGDITHVHGFLLVPLSGNGLPPVIAAFRAADLRLIGSARLTRQSKATWCAVRAVDQEILYSSEGHLPVHAYKLTLTGNAIELRYDHEHVLRSSEARARPSDITGGEISAVSGILYLAHDGAVSVFQTDGSFVDSSVILDRATKSFQGGPSAFRYVRAVTLWEEKHVTMRGTAREVRIGDVHGLCATMDFGRGRRFCFKHFEIEQPSYVGNADTREMHRKNCIWERKMSYRNKVSLPSLRSGLARGFDGCFYCLRRRSRSED